MLKKKNRVDRKSVDLIFKGGKSINTPSLNLKFILSNGSGAPRISFIAPKSVAKFAVRRNSLRRRGYNILGKYVNKFPPGFTGVFIFKKYQDNILVLENEIKNILNKIN